MYLSRLLLNPRSRRVQREVANPYELHRTLLRAFPENSVHKKRGDSESSGVLYRLDLLPPYNDFVLLVQSQMMPNWSFLQGEEQVGYLHTADPFGEENPAVKERELTFRAGQRLQFRLRANPTKRLSAGTHNKGKRSGIYEEGEQVKWLERKASDAGFRLANLQTSRDERIKVEGAIPRNEDRLKLEMHTVQFDGLLQVIEPELFRTKALLNGIGSGKAFGCGLLSVATAR